MGRDGLTAVARWAEEPLPGSSQCGFLQSVRDTIDCLELGLSSIHSDVAQRDLSRRHLPVHINIHAHNDAGADASSSGFRGDLRLDESQWTRWGINGGSTDRLIIPSI